MNHLLRLPGSRSLKTDHTLVMGILNITPNSFSDGNLYLDRETAVKHALAMIEEGADLIDIGGESSRPGSEPVDANTEISRVIPVIRQIRAFSQIPLSIDTYHAETAREALKAGADIINDISALTFDPEMINVLQENPDVPVILMHIKGTPRDMQKNPEYQDCLKEILSYFNERIDYCIQNGISRDRIVIDPGIGFGKRLEDNLLILKEISAYKTFQVPVLLGTSRKSFINQIYPSEPSDRLAGTLATTAVALANGIEIIRVHDVVENVRFIKTMNAIKDR